MMLAPPPQKVDPKHWKEGKAITVTKTMGSQLHYYQRKKLGMNGIPDNEEVKSVMGIPQHYEFTRAELGESIPPAYSEFIARGAIQQMNL